MTAVVQLIRRDEIALLRARPGFREAARAFASGLAESYRGNLLLNRMLNDRGRFTLALLMLDMHYQGEDPDSPGLTVGRLKAQASELDICSPGRAGAVLAAFRLVGLVEPVPDRDRRLNRLAATDKLLDLHRERWRGIFESMAPVVPEVAQGLPRIGQPVFEAAFVAALLQPFRQGWRMVDDIPALAVFIDRDAGMAIALSMLEAGDKAPAPPIAHLARHFRVSRSHILATLQQAEQAGLVRRPAARGEVFAEPALIEALETMAAISILMQARAVRHACAIMDGDVSDLAS